MSERATATPTEALLAVSRLLGRAAAAAGPAPLRDALVREARSLFGVTGAALLAVDEPQQLLSVLAADPAPTGRSPALALAGVPAVRDLLELRLASAHGAIDGTPLASALGWGSPTTLFVPVRDRGAVGHVIALADAEERPFSPAEQELAAGFAAAAGGALAQVQLADEHARHLAEQSALARAAKTLNENLDLGSLLTDICREAQSIVDADASAIYLGDASGVVAEAVWDLDKRVLGYRLAGGEGMAGRVAASGQPLLTNDYQGLAGPGPDSPFAEILSGMAVPMVWDGALHGVLTVGYRKPHAAGTEELRLLETCAELAAAACRNANAAAGLALAARTDALTGCLNHAALHDGLRSEIERSARTAQNLSLVLFDLDGFKQVNEEHGHLVGDEVLRRVGHALRSVVRPYDLCARYGGDEFAIVCSDTDERDAAEIATRAVERVAATLSDVEAAHRTGATAGIARWIPGQSATALLEEADRALLYGKQQQRRGDTILASEIPSGFRPRRFKRADAAPVRPEPPPGQTGSDALQAQRQAERLQKRTRQLVLANALGARLSGMQHPDEIVNAAVDELHRAFGYFLCAVIRLRDDGFVEGVAARGEPFVRLVGENQWSQPRHAGIIGRGLRERRVVLVNDVTQEPAYAVTEETSATKAELVAPIWVGGRLWGVLNIEEDHVDAFDDDDARLVQMVADQLGAALRSAQLYAQLERAYIGTAEALTTALGNRDVEMPSSVRCAGGVAVRLGLESRAVRDVRLAAALHEISRFAEVHEIDALADVAPLVRGAKRPFDPSVPLGARIIAVCSAHAAGDTADDLRAGAGTRFDAAVVEALLAVLAEDPEVASLPSEGWQSG